MEPEKPQWKVRLRAESGERFELSPGETVLGRLYPTKWDDLHIPRKQLIVKVDEKLRTVEVKRVSDVPATLRRNKMYEIYEELRKDEWVELHHHDVLSLAFRKFFVGIEKGWSLPEGNARPVWLSRPRPPSPPRRRPSPPPKRKTTPPDSPNFAFELSHQPKDDDDELRLSPPRSSATASPPKPNASTRPIPEREPSLVMMFDDDDDIIEQDPFATSPAKTKIQAPAVSSIVPQTSADDSSTLKTAPGELVSSGRDTASLARREGVPARPKPKHESEKKKPGDPPRANVKRSGAATNANSVATEATSKGSSNRSNVPTPIDDDDEDNDAFEQYVGKVQPTKSAGSHKPKKEQNSKNEKKRGHIATSDDSGYESAEVSEKDRKMLGLLKRARANDDSVPKGKTKGSAPKSDSDIYDSEDNDSDSDSKSKSRPSSTRSAKAITTSSSSSSKGAASQPKPIPPVRKGPPIEPVREDGELPKFDGLSEEAAAELFRKWDEENDRKHAEAMERYFQELADYQSSISNSSAVKSAASSTSAASNAKKRKADSLTSGGADRSKKSKTGDKYQDELLEQEFGFQSSSPIDLTKS